MSPHMQGSIKPPMERHTNTMDCLGLIQIVVLAAFVLALVTMRTPLEESIKRLEARVKALEAGLREQEAWRSNLRTVAETIRRQHAL